MNELVFWHTDESSRNVKDCLKIFSFARFKILLASQIARSVKQLCFRKGEVNQPNILHGGRDSKKVNGYLRIFDKVLS